MEVEAVIGAAAGAGLTAFLAKALITRSLKELEQISSTISQIQSSLSSITTKIEHIEKDRNRVYVHDRKIAAMENQIYGKRKRSFAPVD